MWVLVALFLWLSVSTAQWLKLFNQGQFLPSDVAILGSDNSSLTGSLSRLCTGLLLCCFCLPCSM